MQAKQEGDQTHNKTADGATSGKLPGHVKGKMENSMEADFSGVQRQEDDNTTVVNVNDSLFSQKVISGIPYKGAIYKEGIDSNGKKRAYCIRHIVTPNKDQWVELLKYGDQIYYNYILGFLTAAQIPGWSSMGRQDNIGIDQYGNKNQSFTECFFVKDGGEVTTQNKRDFLEALFACGQREQNVKLPKDSFLNPSVPLWTKFYSELGKFVSENLHLVISSAVQNQSILDSEHLQNLAGLGADSRSAIAPHLIAGAFATAVSSGKYLIEELGAVIDGVEEPHAILDSPAFDMVMKSGVIIEEALKGYDVRVDESVARSKAIFENVWDAIPLGFATGTIKNEVTKHFIELAVSKAKGVLCDKFSALGSKTDLSTINEYSQEFGNIINEIKTPIIEAAMTDGIPIGDSISLASIIEILKGKL